MAAWVALGAVPAAAQASVQYQLTPETRLAAQFAYYARTCTIEKDVRDRFDRRAVAWLEARQGREVPAGPDGDYRAAVEARLWPTYVTEGLCRQFGCVAGVVEFAAASPPPDCPSFVPRFLGMRINKSGWIPQDGLQ